MKIWILNYLIKKYVYLEWSDELEGKDCILTTTYKDLKDFVNSGDEDRFCKVDNGEEKPFTNHWRECDFCYAMPMLLKMKMLIIIFLFVILVLMNGENL